MNNSEKERFLREAEKDWNLERVRNIYKFDFFFTGLVFAIVSFAIQFPVKNKSWILKIVEGFSWLLFIIAGICSLYVCGGFITRHTEIVLKKREARIPKVRFCMWLFFIAAILVLVIVKIVDLIWQG